MPNSYPVLLLWSSYFFYQKTYLKFLTFLKFQVLNLMYISFRLFLCDFQRLTKLLKHHTSSYTTGSSVLITYNGKNNPFSSTSLLVPLRPCFRTGRVRGRGPPARSTGGCGARCAAACRACPATSARAASAWRMSGPRGTGLGLIVSVLLPFPNERR